MSNKSLFYLVIILTLLGLSACRDASEHRIELILKPSIDGQLLDCKQDISWVNAQWQIHSLALYASQISINGELVKPLALLRCGEALVLNYDKQTKPLHLEFTLGVPFSQNHANPLLAEPPLNEPDMFWVWRNGYKFLRLDMQSASDSFQFHLGSAACDSAAPVRAPKAACKQPNRVKVSLNSDQVNPPQQVLRFDLNALLTGLAPTQENTCMFSGNTQDSCATLLNNLSSAKVFSL